MSASSRRSHRLLLLTLVFECGLGAVAWGVGRLTGHAPWVGWEAGVPPAREMFESLAWGSLATIPLVAALVLSDRLPSFAPSGLRELVRRRLIPLFRGMAIWQFALISLAAGWGEELLFRGLIQAGLARLVGPPGGVWAGLLLASLLFGLCHWLSRSYAVLAAAMGLYLGGLLLVTGDILAPIVTHALYDLAALVYLVRWTGREA